MVSTHGYVAARPPLGAADTGGQVVYVLELSKKLAQLGYEVDIWTRRFGDQAEVEPVAERVRILRMNCGGNNFIPKEYLYRKLPEWCENALSYIDRHQLAYQFIDSHYWDAGVVGQQLASQLGVPHFHTPHSLGIWKKRQMAGDFPGSAEKFELQYNFEARIEHEREIYAAAKMVIATSPQQYDIIRRDYDVPPEHCRMIPPGYDDQRFYPVSESSRQAIRKRIGFSGKVVLANGRLARNKGYDLLINAFDVLAGREPEAVLYLAAGGGGLTDLERTILAELKSQVQKLGLRDRVRLGGFIADADLADYYRAADLFVLSSRYEPFGMTAVEAMASGTPTVVTTHGGLYRALTFGRHALYADPFDREDLGITMLKVFRHPRLRERLNRMGAHQARSLFTWTGVAQQLVSAVERRPYAVAAISDNEWNEPWIDAD